MLQEKLTTLRPYVTGIRFVKDLAVVDMVLKEGWNIFESPVVSYKPSNNNKNYFMLFPKNPTDSIDVVVKHAEHVIEVNIEKENKLVLLRAKMEELKTLFTNKPLSELEKLKFTIESLPEPTLDDLTLPPTSRHSKVNGIELPPKEENTEKVLEKEEN